MKMCPDCKEILVLANDKFCTICGKELVPMPPMPTCNGCGKEIWPYMRYCTTCGLSRENALLPKEPPPSVVTPVAPTKWYHRLFKRS